MRFPENSLAGFRAGRAAGVDALEMDLHLDREGEFWVLHDPVPDERHLPEGRAPGDFGWWGEPIERLGAAERGQLRAVSRPACGSGEGGEAVPTFREVLAALAGRDESGRAPESYPQVVAEIKSDPLRPGAPSPRAIAGALLDLWKEAPAGLSVAVKSFDWRVLEAIGEAGESEGLLRGALVARPHDRRDPLVPGNLYRGSPWLGKAGETFRSAGVTGSGGEIGDDRLVAVAARSGWSFLSVRADEDFAGLVPAAHREGIAVWAWTVTDPGQARTLAALGVDGLVCDDPVGVRAALEGKGEQGSSPEDSHPETSR